MPWGLIRFQYAFVRYSYEDTENDEGDKVLKTMISGKGCT